MWPLFLKQMMYWHSSKFPETHFTVNYNSALSDCQTNSIFLTHENSAIGDNQFVHFMEPYSNSLGNPSGAGRCWQTFVSSHWDRVQQHLLWFAPLKHCDLLQLIIHWIPSLAAEKSRIMKHGYFLFWLPPLHNQGLNHPLVHNQVKCVTLMISRTAAHKEGSLVINRRRQERWDKWSGRWIFMDLLWYKFFNSKVSKMQQDEL